jgi:3-hydroxyisobutyrate dehydrogenase-like beta-hydroxyacid dehydrogenase
MTTETPATASAGVIGLGIIGSRVVACLRRSGYELWLWNRTVRPEPGFLSSPAEVAESCKHIQLFVSNGEALLSVVRAMAPALTPEHIIINHATISLQETLEAASIVADRHAAFLDAPFTGSRDAAQNGQLVYYVGGDAEVIARARPLLEVSSCHILPVGDIGQATVLKVATNIISASQVSALSEALALLDRHDVELSKLSLALERNAARSGVIDMKLPCMLAADFEPRFSLKHMFKDVQLALAMAQEKDIELPTASAFAGMAMAGIHREWGDEDFSVLARFYDYPGRGHTVPPPPEGRPEAAGSSATAPEPVKHKTFKNLWGFLHSSK